MIIYYSGSSSTKFAVGPGPERAVYREVIPILQDRYQYWQLRHQHLAPVFSVNSNHPDPERLRWFWAFGLYQALHFVLFCQGASPISFLLPLAFIEGEKGMLLSRSYIHAMDPTLGRAIDPWFSLSFSDPIPKDPRDPVYVMIVQVLDMQVSFTSTICILAHLNNLSPAHLDI